MIESLKKEVMFVHKVFFFFLLLLLLMTFIVENGKYCQREGEEELTEVSYGEM